MCSAAVPFKLFILVLQCENKIKWPHIDTAN